MAMAENSRIEWTNHTFNPWWGCAKVSAACKYCYAETWAKRVGSKVWGHKAERRFFGDKHWYQPLKWDREAKKDGKRRRVFCASMADVFEDRRELDVQRVRLWRLIEETPNLDWLLLTKRPEKISDLSPWIGGEWPRNVWLGTTIERQKWVGRIDAILKHTARIHFLSCEPLLGPLDIRAWTSKIDWVIAGGESGPKARPTKPAWVEQLRDQCIGSGVAFHFKQWGYWSPFPPDRGTRRFIVMEDGNRLYPVGKKAAGRVIDGRTWDELPDRRILRDDQRQARATR